MTRNDCAAVPPEPPASVAVTVTVVSPAASGVTVSVEPDTDTAATSGDDDTAAQISVSPSSSRNATAASTAAAPPPTGSTTGASVPTAAGGRFLVSFVTASRYRGAARLPPSLFACEMDLLPAVLYITVTVCPAVTAAPRVSVTAPALIATATTSRSAPSTRTVKERSGGAASVFRTPA